MTIELGALTTDYGRPKLNEDVEIFQNCLSDKLVFLSVPYFYFSWRIVLAYEYTLALFNALFMSRAINMKYGIISCV